jgi:hypothetical protein
MIYRRRKGIRALILALATAAVLVPAASGHVYFAGGAKADYSGLTPQALQAMNERWTTMAERYTQITRDRPDDRGGIRGGQSTVSAPDYVDRQVANVERHSSESVRADDRGGIRGPGPIATPAVISSHGDGFDWTDAGIGASAALFAAALVSAAALISRRRTGFAV